MTDQLMQVESGVSRLSAWIDAGRPVNVSDDAQLWHRLGKISEENGELIEALIGAMGMNPRKGFSHTWEDVDKEILDVIVTGLCALEHRHSNQGVVAEMLYAHVQGLLHRVGLSPIGGPAVQVGDCVRVLEWDNRDNHRSYRAVPPAPVLGEVMYVGTKRHAGQPTLHFRVIDGSTISCFAAAWEKATRHVQG